LLSETAGTLGDEFTIPESAETTLSKDNQQRGKPHEERFKVCQSCTLPPLSTTKFWSYSKQMFWQQCFLLHAQC
jgi:hypothetical protein